MLHPHEIAQLDSWQHASRGHTFDVVIAGRIFGGRSGEAPQRPESYEITPDGLLLFFGGGVEVPFVQADGTRVMLRQGGPNGWSCSGRLTSPPRATDHCGSLGRRK